jgi:hypothetical protein
MSSSIHALNIGIIVVPLCTVTRALGRPCAGHTSHQQSGCCPGSGTPATVCHRADGGADQGAHHRALHTGIGGRLISIRTTNLPLGKLPADRIVLAELIEVLAGARQHHDTRTRGQGGTRPEEQCCPQG